jgi:hypothetical protein
MNDQVRVALLHDVHLRVCLDETAGDDPASADVLYFAKPVDAHDVLAQLAAYPGCVVCAGTAYDGSLLLAVRGGIGSCPAIASIMHALLACGVMH